MQVELLLAYLLKCPRLRLYLEFDRALAQEILTRMEELIARRAAREPLQYILGTAPFCELELAVDKRVMVPRPETELLAEEACRFLSAQFSKDSEKERTVIDFGTGSGCLAILLARRFERVRLHAVDLSGGALALASENARRHGVESKIGFWKAADLDELPEEIRGDLIITNPPYIPRDEIQELAMEVRDHEPRLALDGGPDGLDFYRRLAVSAASRLRSEGRFLAEFGDGQETEVVRILELEKWIVESVMSDYNARPRIVVAARTGRTS